MIADALKVVVVKSGCGLIVEEFLETGRQSVAILLETVDQNLLDLLRNSLVPAVFFDKQRQALIESDAISHKPTCVRASTGQQANDLQTRCNQFNPCFITSIRPFALE